MSDLVVRRPQAVAVGQDESALWRAYRQLPIAACLCQDGHIVATNPAFDTFFAFDPSTDWHVALHALHPRQREIAPSSQMRALQDRAGRTVWCRISRLTDGADSYWFFEDAKAERELAERARRLQERVSTRIASRTVAVRRANVEYRRELQKLRVFDIGLTQSREKYRVLFQNSETGILFVDDSGAISQSNAAMQLLLGARNQIDFKNIANRPICRIGGRDAAISLAELARYLVRDVLGDQECLVTVDRPGKPEIWIDVRCTRMHVKDFSAALTMRDRTEEILASRREAEQRHQLNRMGRISLAGHLGSAVAHELGQPLNACMSYLGGLENIVAADKVSDAVQHGLTQLRKELYRASDVLKNMRQFVSNHAPVCQSVCMSELVNNTRDLLLPTMRDGGVTLELVMALHDEVMVQGNAVEIQQVLVNLAMNAFDAALEAGRGDGLVTMAIEPYSHDRIVCSVTDNGGGISSELRGKLFKPYQTTKNGGLGLGLSMCRNIIESHGGQIWVDPASTAGTTFRFTLLFGAAR